MTVSLWQVAVVIVVCALLIAWSMAITHYAYKKTQGAIQTSTEAYELVALSKANCEAAKRDLEQHKEDLQRYIRTVEDLMQDGPCLIEISDSLRTLPPQGRLVVVLDVASMPVIASYDGGAYPQHRFITPQGSVLMGVSRYVIFPE